ncbi:MAG: AMMECR1 domain-containing protein [Leptospiraceae bacterium]|nr:AMMECR1 domain-containing protein [Leptospiraceae bacterium]
MKYIIFFLLLNFSLLSEDYDLNLWKEFKTSKKKSIFLSYINCILDEFSIEKKCENNIPQTPKYFGKLGVFLTFHQRGRVRGCFGSFTHKSENFNESLKEYINGAISEDPRFSPISKNELKQLDWKLTIASSPKRELDPENINLKREGVYLVGEGNNIIYVPGEIKSVNYLKNIIKMKKISEIYKFDTVIFNKPAE